MGDCTRRKVGALIVGPDKRFWGLGYNGARPGGKSCLEGDCPRGRHARAEKAKGIAYCPFRGADHYWDAEHETGTWCSDCAWMFDCLCGNEWPCPDAVEPGSSYDTGAGACINTHAEGNAKTDAQMRGGGRLAGCTMYVSCEPCEGCVRDIRNNTDIVAIIWPDGAIGLP